MAWKPKEKPLTLEEAVALARKELAPFWLGSEPLFAGVRGANGAATVHPLNEAFTRRNWLLLFLDPTTFSGGTALGVAREWHRRYGALELGIIAVLCVPYAGLRRPELIEHLLPKQQFSFPVVMDPEGLLASAFSARDLPKVLLLGKGKPVFESAGAHWLKSPELELQSFLRSTDPGLPLPPPLTSAAGAIEDVDRVDFAAGDANARMVTRGGVPVTFSGPWGREGECFIPQDETSRVRFDSPSPFVGLVARSLSGSPLPSDVAVEVIGRPAWDDISGEEIHMSEDGSSVARVQPPRLYRILRNLPDGERNVELSFPSARETRIGVLGLRFGR